jgi:SNF2 family DNA or RNA helicase
MCAEGLNLQNYNEVYFVSPTYNPSIEQQAIARCYRRGQQKDVYVFKFNMKSLIEHKANDLVNTLSDKIPTEIISHIWDYINPTQKGQSICVSSTDEHISKLSQTKQDIIDKYILPSTTP